MQRIDTLYIKSAQAYLLRVWRLMKAAVSIW
jgi:hypothetical protein